MPAAVDVMAVLVEHGVLLESARGPIPNVAELVAGEPISGSWWGHHDSHAIFAVINELADSPDVVRLRLVTGTITLIGRAPQDRNAVPGLGAGRRVRRGVNPVRGSGAGASAGLRVALRSSGDDASTSFWRQYGPVWVAY